MQCKGFNGYVKLVGHSDLVYCVAISGDSKRIASGSNDRTIVIWNAATVQHIRTLRGHEAEVACMDFSCEAQQG